MGLFDIFRRKKQPAEPEQPVAAPTSEESEPSGAPTPTSSANPVSEPAAPAPAPVEADEPQPAAESASESAEPQPAAGDDGPEEPAATPKATVQVPAPETVTSAAPVSEEPAASATADAGDTTPAASSAAVKLEQAETGSESEAAESSAAPVPQSAAKTATEGAVAATEPATTVEPADDKYEKGLAKSRSGFGARLNKFLANFRHVDEDFFEDLEDLLIESDVGFEMTQQLSDALREEVKLQNAKTKQDVSNVIIEKMVELYEAAGQDEQTGLQMAPEGPTVIMFVGVNGAGKTTTIGKMAAAFKQDGKKVLLVAADTFRAGATEQLAVWAERDGVDIVTGPEKGDPAAVVFDGVKRAKEANYDILLVDTAGRLQNKVNLMNELAKMKKILTREIPAAPHEVLLVLDSTTGQNALNQAKLFKESTDVTGIVLTKLDGTARGGIVLAIRNELHLPVKYVGLGEKVDDLQVFDPAEFVYGLFKGLVTTK
ncbi:signal recognition particle-docking protein FtsY [Limosilactobacillus ingluviei]|uniref:signal recognition particle-docking protein FtsY n=1 Tax=Limosilactobacillus ingluviei TaxID=148604 RepID=UPI00265E1A92|nr:signal recognition particle-docking protein FtsY [Limosilactobacillus ingluviei]